MGMMFKNGIPYAGVPDEIDATTVGGHTVEADVPADAAFTDTINSDITAEGNPVILKELQGGVPFSEITVKGENISGQEMTLTTTGKNQLPITVTSGTGAGVTYTVDNDEITVSGTTTGVSTITVSAPNMTITQDMRLSYRGNLSGMTPKATILRNGETVYPTPNDTTGSKLLAGDVLQNVYIQQQSADVAVSGFAKFQLEYGTEVTEYEKYSSETYTFTPDSVDYLVPTDIIQKENVNVLAIDAEGATLSVTGVRTNAAVAKLWNKSGAGNVSGYTAGDGIEISEDKVVSNTLKTASDITCTKIVYEVTGMPNPTEMSIQECIDKDTEELSSLKSKVKYVGWLTTGYNYDTEMEIGQQVNTTVSDAIKTLDGAIGNVFDGVKTLKSEASRKIEANTAEGGTTSDYEGYFKPENENGLYLLNVVVDIMDTIMLAPLSLLVNFNGSMSPRISALPYDSNYAVSGSTYTFSNDEEELFKVSVSGTEVNGAQMLYVKVTNINLESLSTTWNVNVRFVKMSD